MNLSELDKREIPELILLQTSGSRLEMLIQDKIKLKLHVVRDEIIELSTRADYKRVREVIGLNPQVGSRWLVLVNLDKQYSKDLLKLIDASNTCTFFCTCSKYRTFKTFKEDFKNDTSLMDFYIMYMRRPDFLYLHDMFTTHGNGLRKKVMDFVVGSYSSDVDAIMELMVHLGQGEVFDSEKSVREICGTAGSSVEMFIFSLLKPLSGSDKGLRITIKNRISVAFQIADGNYGYLYDNMIRSIKIFCQMKMLLISGKIYKDMRNIPDNFDETALVKNQRHLRRVKEIPLSEFLVLYKALGSTRWTSEIDFISFIYKYYGTKGRRLLCQ